MEGGSSTKLSIADSRQKTHYVVSPTTLQIKKIMLANRIALPAI